MGPDLKMVIRLQDLDNRIRDLEREISLLPKHIARIEKTLDAHNRRLDADRAALAANQRERKKIEGDIQVQEQKISKLRDQMLQAKTNEQYGAFKREIDFCEAEIRKCEDRILDRMSEAESLDQNVKTAEAALGKEKQHVEGEKKVARDRTAESQRQLTELKQERARVVASIGPDVYSSYERIRGKRKGIAVAESVDGRCSACNMSLRLQFYQELRRGDKVMFCESCGRILYYNPPVEAEDVGAESHAVETNP